MLVVVVQSSNRVKLTDFGLAKLLEHDKGEFYAASGKVCFNCCLQSSRLPFLKSYINFSTVLN